MANAFDREVIEILETQGCHLVRHGRHTIWCSPLSKRNFPVPTGIKGRHTANEVLIQAGLPKQF